MVTRQYHQPLGGGVEGSSPGVGDRDDITAHNVPDVMMSHDGNDMIIPGKSQSDTLVLGQTL